MERVINHLFDIEKKANQIIERANAEKQELYEENEKEIAKLEADISEENNAKINLLLSQADSDLEKERRQLIENSNKQLTELEDHYRVHHDALVNKVIQSILQL